jgi:hypothetical protein
VKLTASTRSSAGAEIGNIAPQQSAATSEGKKFGIGRTTVPESSTDIEAAHDAPLFDRNRTQ